MGKLMPVLWELETRLDMVWKAGILSFLMVFNVNVAYGVDIVVKIEKYAPLTGDCDTAINNVEVMF